MVLKKKTFRLVKIKKIEFSDEEIDMFDLEVPHYENFILEDGIVTHNSANLELNVIRQSDYLLLKPSSLLQLDFERKKIKDIYVEVKKFFEQYKDEKGLTYVYSDSFRGFVSNSLPTFWNQDVSKAYASKEMKK